MALNKELRFFGITIAAVLIVITAGVLVFAGEFMPAVLFAAFVFAAASIFLPQLLYYPYRGWMFLARVLGFVATHIILFVAFCVLVVPLSVIGRIAGKRFLATQWGSANEASFWHYRSPAEKEKRYEQQF